jgi:hypothetical protein
MSREELRMDLEQYDFVTPTGEPFAPLLNSLMKETWTPRPLLNATKTTLMIGNKAAIALLSGLIESDRAARSARFLTVGAARALSGTAAIRFAGASMAIASIV